MPVIEIKPMDTLFFRNGKPFDMGEDNWAEGIFPPSPRSFYGAIRSAYFAANPSLIELANTSEDPTNSLRINGFWIKRGDGLFCPSPLDYVRKKKDKTGRLIPAKLVKQSEVFAGIAKGGYPFDFIPYSKDDVQSSAGYMIDSDALFDYHPDDDIYGCEVKSFFSSEPKIGVGLDNKTRSNSEGKLYRVGLNRLHSSFDQENRAFKEQVSFVLDYDFDYVPKVLKLGGEGKTAFCSTYNNGKLAEEIHTTDWSEESKFFRLVFLTPSFLEKGWKLDLSGFLDNEFEIKLILAFVGKPEAIGGWSIKEKKPKPMKKAIPAGSTYYFQIKSGHSINDVVKELKKTPVLNSDVQAGREGFGLFVCTSLDLNSITIDL